MRSFTSRKMKMVLSISTALAAGCGASPEQADSVDKGPEQAAPIGENRQTLVSCSTTPGANQALIRTSITNVCNLLEIGAYNDPTAFGLPNDSITHVTLGSDVEVVFYSNINLQGLPYVASASGALPMYYAQEFTDYPLASSLRVRKVRNCGSPGANQVVLWEHGSYTGRCSILGVGDYYDDVAMGIPNDTVSSVAIGSNVQLEIYNDTRFQGTLTPLTASATSVGGANDAASSVKVRWQNNCPSPAADEVVVWEHGSFTGRCSVLKAGKYATPQAMGIPNDTVSSISVGSSMKATIFADSFTGTRADYGSSSSTVGALNDLASSLRVQWARNCPHPSPTQAVIWADINYSGDCNVLELPTADSNVTYPLPDDFGLPNDSISSVEVGSSARLTVYADGNLGGSAYLLGSTPNMGLASTDGTTTVNINDQASSLRLYRRGQGTSVAKPMLFIKCKFADFADEPNTMYLEDYYTKKGAGSRNIYDYWVDQTYGKYDITATEMVGWYSIGVNRLDACDRECLVQACLTASGKSSSGYSAIVALMNASHDDGGVGGANWALIGGHHLAHSVFVTHEIAHALGLGHPHRTSDGADYGDPWDLMSAMSVIGTGSGSPHGLWGPGISVLNREVLGAMPAAPPSFNPPSGTTTSYTLAPLNDASHYGHLYVEIPASLATYRTLVEYRRKIGPDDGMSTDSVFVHQDRGTAVPWLIDAAPGPQLTNGEVIWLGSVRLTVGALTATGASISLYRP